MRGKTNSVTTSGGGSSENTLKKLLDATKSTSYLFYNYRGTSVDDLISYNDTENVTNTQNMFSSCTMITSIPLFNTEQVTNMPSMFSSCEKLKILPTFNTSKVTNMNSTFISCYLLEEIPALDASNVTSMGTYTFYNCNSLKAIHMTGMKVSFDISSSTKFTTEALHEIIGNLATVTSSQTLTMGSRNLAKVSEEYKAIATNKGWTLA